MSTLAQKSAAAIVEVAQRLGASTDEHSTAVVRDGECEVHIAILRLSEAQSVARDAPAPAKIGLVFRVVGVSDVLELHDIDAARFALRGRFPEAKGLVLLEDSGPKPKGHQINPDDPPWWSRRENEVFMFWVWA